tara:strand:- start:2229 stop:2849 length:621 start_codon:yes stop_codon:yes gene_type:complete
MNIEEIEIEKLIPYHNNPRKNQDVDKVASSLSEYGFQQPIVVDKKLVVIVGHTRLLGAKKLGLKKVPVLIADLSEAKARGYRIADNRIAEDANWDYDLLKLEIDLLKEINFNIDELGFEEQELETIIFQNNHDSRDWLDTEEHWQDMPSFEHTDQSPHRSLTINFVNQDAVDKFFQLIKQDYTEKTKYVWFPSIEKRVVKDKYYEN